LIAHGAGPEGDLQRVVLGVDGSEGSTRAVDVLSEVVDEERCEVTVACIVPDPPPPIALAGLGLSPGKEEEDFERFTASARDLAKKTADTLKGRGFQVHTEVRVGSPSSVLLEEGEEAGLIAVGANGLGSFRRAIVGSVSEAVVRHAKAALVAR
jgi:nucleotide-binding universal stress UspA family protein